MPTTLEARASYQVIQFIPTPDRQEHVSNVLRSIAAHETLFTEFRKSDCPGIQEGCNCEECSSRIYEVANMLTKPDALVWEVWKLEGSEVDLSGILYLTDILPGNDASAHYVFFDSRLHDKTDLLEEVIQWIFEDHEDIGWKALRRITVTVPDFAASLAAHATKHLGFGGEFEYQMGKRTLPVEGVKRNAVMWRGELRDMLILGRSK